MDLAEDFIQFVIKYAIAHCQDDLEFLEQRLIDEDKSKPTADRAPMKLREKLNFVLENSFKRVSYTEAIEILKILSPTRKNNLNIPSKSGGRPAK